MKGRWGNAEEAALVWEKKLEMRAGCREKTGRKSLFCANFELPFC